MTMTVDLLFTHANVYNVFLKEWFVEDVAVHKGRIFYTGNARADSIQGERTIDCQGKPLISGLIDIHLHIESSLCTPFEFSHAVLARGVTTVVADPHEIANVSGLAGIEEMIRLSREAAIDIFYGIPSSVPSTRPELESTGGIIRQQEMLRLLEGYPEVICLGEVMDFHGLINGTAEIQQSIESIRGNYPLVAVEGHCPDIHGRELASVLYHGVDSDHCLQHLESMKDRFKQGMFVEIQEKSVRPEIISYLSEQDRDGLYCFVTDDVPPDILCDKGHLDHVVRKAMQQGLPLEKSIIASSYAPAKRMGFRDRGTVSPGKTADLLLLTDKSEHFQIQRIFKNGREYEGKTQSAAAQFSTSFRNTLKIPQSRVSKEIFTVRTAQECTSVRCRVMHKSPDSTYTEERALRFPVRNGFVCWQEEEEINLVHVLNRYSGLGEYACGFVSGEIFRQGAVCSSYAHDSHNLLTAGDNEDDMLSAMQWVIEHQGGICVVSRGRINASLPLPIGGILSEEPMEQLADAVKKLQQAIRELGYRHPNPLMSFSTLTLPVSPALKITDKGLIDVHTTELVGLFLTGDQLL